MIKHKITELQQAKAWCLGTGALAATMLTNTWLNLQPMHTISVITELTCWNVTSLCFIGNDFINKCLMQKNISFPGSPIPDVTQNCFWLQPPVSVYRVFHIPVVCDRFPHVKGESGFREHASAGPIQIRNPPEPVSIFYPILREH